METGGVIHRGELFWLVPDDSHRVIQGDAFDEAST